jgi:hypothetical protein
MDSIGDLAPGAPLPIWSPAAPFRESIVSATIRLPPKTPPNPHRYYTIATNLAGDPDPGADPAEDLADMGPTQVRHGSDPGPTWVRPKSGACATTVSVQYLFP